MTYLRFIGRSSLILQSQDSDNPILGLLCISTRKNRLNLKKLNILQIIEWVERAIVFFLVILLLISLVLGTIDLSLVVLKGIFDSPIFLIRSDTLFKTFGLFLVIVIGLELLKSIKSYLIYGTINPAFVVEVAIIALGNKLITMDITHSKPGILIGIGVILFGLSALYFILKKTT